MRGSDVPTVPGVRLLVVRHGESTWNAAGRWQGQADPPLSPKGEDQALSAAEALAINRFDRVFSSDLTRARRTAQIMAARLKLAEVLLDPGLREIDVGEWSGLTRPEIELRWPGAREEWSEGRLKAAPGGESVEALTARVNSALQRIIGIVRAAPNGKYHGRQARQDSSANVLIVSHRRAISALEQSLGARPLRPGHLSGRWFDCSPDGSLRAADAVHLLGEPASVEPAVGDSNA